MISQMLLDKLYNYEIIKKQNKTTQGAFTYYIITEGEGGVSKMLTHDYGEWEESLKCLCMIMGDGEGLTL